MPLVRRHARRRSDELPAVPPVDRRVRFIVPRMPVAALRRRQARDLNHPRRANRTRVAHTIDPEPRPNEESHMPWQSENGAVRFSGCLADLMSISDAGGIMPPKSTWFEPKLRDGLLVHEI